MALFSWVAEWWRERALWRRERASWERARRDIERRDTVEALREVVAEYRAALEAVNEERRRLQGQLVELLERGHQRDAEIVAALREVGEAIRAHSVRIERLERCVAARQRMGTDKRMPPLGPPRKRGGG